MNFQQLFLAYFGVYLPSDMVPLKYDQFWELLTVVQVE